jgi:hypothetical protein
MLTHHCDQYLQVEALRVRFMYPRTIAMQMDFRKLELLMLMVSQVQLSALFHRGARSFTDFVPRLLVPSGVRANQGG